jgi:serine/threonine protein kinase
MSSTTAASIAQASTKRPAEKLEGLVLQGGWTVGPVITRGANQSGGYFSTSYTVTALGGGQAFLKAMDYVEALNSTDPAKALNAMTQAYLFERNLVRECRERNMSHVVRAIDDGKVLVDQQPVEYLIFELADGDVRGYLSSVAPLDHVWRLTCLHNLFIGNQQLNKAHIAHQDMKPSNALTYGAQKQKIADLGRAWQRDVASPFDSLRCAGDRRYAPPESLYASGLGDSEEVRFAADFYLLGSMMLFFFTGFQATAALIARLNPAHRWTVWNGTYQEALPYLEHAFTSVVEDLRSSITNPRLAKELCEMVTQMCHPDIAKRGDHLHRAAIGSRFSLQRFISRLDRLRSEAISGKLYR